MGFDPEEDVICFYLFLLSDAIRTKNRADAFRAQNVSKNKKYRIERVCLIFRSGHPNSRNPSPKPGVRSWCGSVNLYWERQCNFIFFLKNRKIKKIVKTSKLWSSWGCSGELLWCFGELLGCFGELLVVLWGAPGGALRSYGTKAGVACPFGFD